MNCVNCGAQDAVLEDGVLHCSMCHQKTHVRDPNKSCPLCGNSLRTTNTMHQEGFRVARRRCTDKECRYSAVVASFTVSTRDGTASQGMGYKRIAQEIQAGRLRLVWDQ